MSLKRSIKTRSKLTTSSSNKPLLLALAIVSSSLITGLSATALTAASVTTTSAQAAGLSDLFSNNKSAAKSKFLPVDQAFQVTSSSSAINNGTRLAINFDITPEHYVYKNNIELTLPAGITAAPFSFSQSSRLIDDPTFGKVPIFDQSNMVATTVLTSTTGNSISNAAMTIGWQGCATAGLCYPPEKINTTVNVAAPSQQTAAPTNSANSKTTTAASSAAARPVIAPVATATATDDTTSATTPNVQTALVGDSIAQQPIDDDSIDTVDDIAIEESIASPDILATSTISGADSNSVENGESTSTTATNSVIDSDPFGLASHPWLAFALLFLAGLGLALTPCVLPMLPIVAAIVGRQENPTAKKGIILTTSYALGVASAYGILGAVIALFGESLGIIGWLQNPVILISFAIVFVFLALYMLGVIKVRLPRTLSNKLHSMSQVGDSKLGSAGGSLVAGFLSALVVSPCVSAPLFGALLAVSTIGSPLLGFVALFMLGFGLSAPLILIGATQGKIMPKAGAWMDWIKIGFGLLLLAVALLLVERVVISPVILLVWALWFMVIATWAWSWLGRGRMLTQALGLVAGIWAVMLVIGAALGNDDSLYPLASLTATPTILQSNTSMIDSNVNDQTISAIQTTDIKVTTLAEIDAIVADNPKVLVDVTAEWCIECRIMDKNLFVNRPVQMQDWLLVRLDITDTNDDSKAILSRYQLFGPPALLYYQEGKLVQQQVGEVGRQAFEQTLTTLN